MKYRNLGKTGVKVSELCLGTMIYGQQVSEAASIKIIKKAVDSGINFIDTADVYVNGVSEEIVGKAIEGMRDEIVLATKVRNVMGPGPNDVGLSRKHIMQAVDASLKRLGTDYIDLYQVHHVDPSTPLKETLVALNDLVGMGKVHYIGCSNFPAWVLEKALRISELDGLEAFVCVQPRYNIVDRDIERELLPLCAEEGIGVIPYSPLAGGFLTGKYRLGKPAPDGTRGQLRPEWMSRTITPRNQAILEELEKICGETGLTMSQLSLAWMMANPVITAPIIGASSLEQLDMNIDVVNHKVSEDSLKRINEVSKPDWLSEQEEQNAQSRAFLEQRLEYWRKKVEESRRAFV
jgi:aryl-alcohol dehydrogenase-like predicted oxidoreductase